MKAILVGGGAGYIGSHTCVELLEQGMEVVVADNLVNSSAKALKRVEQITGKTLTYYQADIRDQAALDRIFEAHSVDCVMHFAGLKAVGESVEKPLEYYTNNLTSTLTLCKSMAAHGVKKIIFSSSATVYFDSCPMRRPPAAVRPSGRRAGRGRGRGPCCAGFEPPPYDRQRYVPLPGPRHAF